jgi:DNA-binding protein YbaB
MFDQLKKMAELKKLQDEIKKETMTVEKRGVSVTMNGAFEVTELKLNPELSIDDQQQTLKQALNEVRENLQKVLAKKMMGAGLGF